MTQRVSWVGAELAGYRRPVGTIASNYIPEFLDLLVHNWASAVLLEVIYSTDVTISQSQVEERVALLLRPSRVMTAHYDGFSRSESARISYLLARTMHQRLLFPLYCDVAKSNLPTVAGDISLSGHFEYRRFFPGQRVVVFDWSPVTRRPENAEILTLAAVNTVQLDFTTTMAVDHRAGARVIPLIESEVMLQGSGSLDTDEGARLTLRVEEVVGNNSIPNWIGFGDQPDYPTYRQIPILTYVPNWDSAPGINVKRAGDKQQEGRAPIIGLAGLRPRIGFHVSFLGLDRALAYRLLSFIDSRNGRLRAFFIPNLLISWTAIAITTNSVTLQYDVSPDDVARFFSYAYFEFIDGTSLIREIVNIEVVGGGIKLTFAEIIPTARASLVGIRHLTSAHLSRFSADSYTENWLTDGTLSVEVETLEILDDRAVDIPYTDDVNIISPNSANGLIGDWVASNTTMFKPNTAAVALTDDQIAVWTDSIFGRPLNALGGQYHKFFAPGPSMRFLNNGGPKYELPGLLSPYSNALGMTVFIVIRRRTPSLDGGNDYLMRIPNASDNGTDVFQWTWNSVVMNETAGVQDTTGWVSTPDAAFARGQTHILCLNWLPGRHLRVYRDGKLIGENVTPIVDMPAILPANVRFFNLGNPNADASSADDSQVYRMTLYNRALTTFEINGLGAALAAGAGTTWSLIV